MMLKTYFFSFFLLSILVVSAQQIDTTNSQYKAYYNSQGNIISEGYLIDGKPNDYWITYYANQLRKSEGNRKNFKLDGPWKFYKENGDLEIIINYKAGIKNGKTKHFENCVIVLVENFKDGKIVDTVKAYFPDSTHQLKSKVPYKNGVKDGLAYTYAKDGRIIELVTYTKGFVSNREKINQKDEQGNKQGIWKSYFPNQRLKKESRYKNDSLNGYEKVYNREGKLESAELYINGEKQSDSKNEADFTIEYTYFENGNVKSSTIFNLDGKKDGAQKEFNIAGEIIASSIYKNDNLIANGIIDSKGRYQGKWQYYYLDGKIRSKGEYKDSKKIGKWIYYFTNGKVEQEGFFNNNGNFTGEWNWYFENGNLLRKEQYKNGKRDGLLEEYELNGNLITKGEYMNGLKDGEWFYELNDHEEKGDYSYGERNGEWIFHHANGKISFEGNFIDGLPDGKLKYYNEKGVLIKEENYDYGLKNGRWKWYDSTGMETLRMLYRNDELKKVNGSKVKFKK